MFRQIKTPIICPMNLWQIWFIRTIMLWKLFWIRPWIAGINYDSYLEYENIKDFKQWILSLKSKDVRDKGIFKMALWKIKNKIKLDRKLNPKTKIIKILIQLYKESKPSKEK